ncbi:hypothetical protein B566_EDAN012808 [Ephemera danica]|nr:hypothetical protein B566_EDAN012808 [Ephemera danica]
MVPLPYVYCTSFLSPMLDIYSNSDSEETVICRFDFICTPIFHPRFKRELISGKCKGRNTKFARSDLILGSSDWNTLIVGKLSPYIDVDSEDWTVRQQSELTFLQELQYCTHLGLPAIMLNLTGPNKVNLARLLHNKLYSNCCFTAWVVVPMEAPKFSSAYYRSDLPEIEEPSKENDTWEWWNTFRSVCNFEKKLGLALEVTANIPSQQEVERWMGEPIKCFIVPTTLFMTNKKGFPVLSRAHQALFRTFSTLDVQLVVQGNSKHAELKHYQLYLEHLWKNSVAPDPLNSYARGYEDYLQSPLQPLMDNLESQTYEVFEKDPVKYTEYQRAIYTAMIDRVPPEKKQDTLLTVMVVGAGRGPLVRATLNAATKADRKVHVYAVEKNPNAVVTLQAQQEEMWGDLVTVISNDMREWKPPVKADILVSELLGSFGDNELSPECLDGAQHLLKDDGISIPSSYTSYISPVQSSKLHNEVLNCKDRTKHPMAHFETPYVVHLQNRYTLAPVQPLFTFYHPNRDENCDNSRYETLQFSIKQNCVLHGFSGYFSTVLYKHISLSIEPDTHSPGMFSWFPIFFPIKEPVHLRAGDELCVHFWRVCSSKSVWYEWCVSSPVPVSVHNPAGRSYSIGL